MSVATRQDQVQTAATRRRAACACPRRLSLLFQSAHGSSTGLSRRKIKLEPFLIPPINNHLTLIRAVPSILGSIANARQDSEIGRVLQPVGRRRQPRQARRVALGGIRSTVRNSHHLHHHAPCRRALGNLTGGPRSLRQLPEGRFGATEANSSALSFIRRAAGFLALWSAHLHVHRGHIRNGRKPL